MTANHSFFEEGLFVKYKFHSGTISFICNEYITILVNKGKHKSHNVNILVYPNEFDLVECGSIK